MIYHYIILSLTIITTDGGFNRSSEPNRRSSEGKVSQPVAVKRLILKEELRFRV